MSGLSASAAMGGVLTALRLKDKYVGKLTSAKQKLVKSPKYKRSKNRKKALRDIKKYTKKIRNADTKIARLGYRLRKILNPSTQEVKKLRREYSEGYTKSYSRKKKYRK